MLLGYFPTFPEYFIIFLNNSNRWHWNLSNVAFYTDYPIKTLAFKFLDLISIIVFIHSILANFMVVR